MARCPECGGSVGPLGYAELRPAPVRCRWCNARFELPGWARLVRDATLVVAAGGGIIAGIVLWRDAGDAIWLMVGLASALLAVLAGLLIEQVARPVARAGRSVSPVESRRLEPDEAEDRKDQGQGYMQP